MSSESDVARIARKLAGRLPPPTDHMKLARDYLDAVLDHAVDRTAGSGVVPSSFNVERAALMFEVSRHYGRLVNVDEIGALLRIQRSAALAVQKVMKATYVDESYELEIAASLVGAMADGRGDYGVVRNGYRVVFKSADLRSDFVDAMNRRGLAAEEAEEEDGKSHLLYVHKSFPIKDYALDPWSAT